jgi:hypothetical protein
MGEIFLIETAKTRLETSDHFETLKKPKHSRVAPFASGSLLDRSRENILHSALVRLSNPPFGKTDLANVV